MTSSDKDLRSVNEIGKIYQSLTEKKALCDFFPQTVALAIEADEGHLFLIGRENRLWLESSLQSSPNGIEKIQKKSQSILESGKACFEGNEMFVPLIVRNDPIGIAYFCREKGKPPFLSKDLELAVDLSYQMAGALKNILLFEQNLEMEKLAAIGKSMGMVLHEIKNIIQIAAFAEEWLVKALQKPEKKYLERGVAGIQKALKEMNGFVYEMLSLTKNYRITPQKVDLKALLDELKEDLSTRAGDVKLDFQVEEGFPAVDAEERSLYRALLNLTKNAIEACDKEQSFVRIRVRQLDADNYAIEITDNGQGMTNEVKAKLFQAFFSTKGEKGTGLGVMIVDRTVRAHYGKIHIESGAGRGTTFRITLPKKIAADEDT